MRAVWLVVTFLLVLPSIALAWPFHIQEGEQAAEFLVTNAKLMGGSALLAALGFMGLYAYRKRAEISEKGGFYASAGFVMSGAKFTKDYYLGQADVFKDTIISSLRFIGSAIGALIDQATKEEVGKKVDREISEGIRPEFSQPMYERFRRWADKLDKSFIIPGEKKILDEGYFYDPANRGRNLGRVMGELGVMSIPAPVASKAWKYAKEWNRARKIVTGIKVARTASYARSAINMAIKAPAAIAAVVPKVSATVKTVSTTKKTTRAVVTNIVSNAVSSVYRAVTGFFRR